MNTTEYEKLRLVVRNQISGLTLTNKKFNDCLLAANFAEIWHTGLRKDGKTKEFYHQYSSFLFKFNTNFKINC